MVRLVMLVLFWTWILATKSRGFRFSAAKKREMQQKKLATLAKKNKAPTKSPARNRQRQVETARGREAIEKKPARMKYQDELDEAKRTGKPVEIENYSDNPDKNIQPMAMPGGYVWEKPRDNVQPASSASFAKANLPEITSGSEKQNKFASDVRGRFVSTLEDMFSQAQKQAPELTKDMSFTDYLKYQNRSIPGAGDDLLAALENDDPKFWIDRVRGYEKSPAEIISGIQSGRFKRKG